MSINIDQFTKSVANSGVLRSNLYTVVVKFPDSLTNEIGRDLIENLTPRIDRITLPTKQLRGVIQKSAYRETRLVPTAYQNLDDLSMQILLSSDMREKKMFLAWQNIIANESNIPSYIDNITGTVTIRTHGTNNGKGDYVNSETTVHTFEDAFPMMISDLELAAGDEEAARLTIIFQYRNWKMSGASFKKYARNRAEAIADDRERRLASAGSMHTEGIA